MSQSQLKNPDLSHIPFQLENFIEKNKENFSEVKKGVEQSLETVKINIQWQNKHANEIEKILRKHSEQ